MKSIAVVHSSDKPDCTGDFRSDRGDCDSDPENGNVEPNFEPEFLISYDIVEEGE